MVFIGRPFEDLVFFWGRNILLKRLCGAVKSAVVQLSCVNIELSIL